MSIGDGKTQIKGLRARAVLVDMEQGVLGQIAKSPVHELFDQHQMISSVSGSGNNWGQGYHYYGTCYKEQILESIRKEAEFCDSLQSFILLQSTGGGTGSGLGAFMNEMICDAYPQVYRFSTSIVPSSNDDVITSPYNRFIGFT